MSPMEWVGLLVAVALTGGLIGGLLAARSARAARRYAHEEHFINALVCWLAARRAWRRSAIRMVRAFRRLAREPRGAADFGRRRRSALRTRKQWEAATRNLEWAQAAMEAWRGDAVSQLRDPPRQPTPTRVRRAALRGGHDRLDALRRGFELADRADLEWVRAERLAMRARRSLLSHLGVWLQTMVWRVIRAWERPR